jgi:anti-sigma B factor antagonist
MGLRVLEERIDGITVISPHGVVKLGESSREFAEYLDRVLKEAAGPVLIDFEGVTYMDSTGLGELIAYLRKFDDDHRKMALVRPSHRIRALLELTRLDEVFDVFDTPNQGLKFLRESL